MKRMMFAVLAFVLFTSLISRAQATESQDSTSAAAAHSQRRPGQRVLVAEPDGDGRLESKAHEKAEEKKEGQVENAAGKEEYGDLHVTDLKMVSETCNK